MFISHDILFHVLDYLCDAHALTFLKYFGSIKFARDIIILLRNHTFEKRHSYNFEKKTSTGSFVWITEMERAMQILLVKFSFFALILGVSIETGTKRARCFANKISLRKFLWQRERRTVRTILRKDRQTIS